jgi:TorA maturation chaperone TorD
MSDANWNSFAAALADDAESLAALHDRELDAATVAALKAVEFPAGLGLLPDGETARDAWQLMAAAVAELPSAPDTAALDELAADYAAIYLTGAHGAAPCESVWLDDDRLVCQAPMFALREIYAQAGLATADWRRRPDDQLVLQLLYIAHALRRAAGGDDGHALARMLDEHLLRWLPEFAVRVASCAAQPFYAGLASLTAAWCDGLRDLLAARRGEPRPTQEQIAARGRKPEAAAAAPLVYMPGAGPGW